RLELRVLRRQRELEARARVAAEALREAAPADRERAARHGPVRAPGKEELVGAPEVGRLLDLRGGPVGQPRVARSVEAQRAQDLGRQHHALREALRLELEAGVPVFEEGAAQDAVGREVGVDERRLRRVELALAREHDRLELAPRELAVAERILELAVVRGERLERAAREVAARLGPLE